MFKALSADVRVSIVQMLKAGPLCVNALASRLGVSPAAVSQHLRVLHDADLVEPRKRGYYVHYSLKEETLATWKETASSLLEPGQEDSTCAERGKCPRELKEQEEDHD